MTDLHSATRRDFLRRSLAGAVALAASREPRAQQASLISRSRVVVAHDPLLRGTGSTLTSYVFENSPAGEGNAPQKAYAAAFVLLMMVVILNMVVIRLSSGRRPWLAGLTPEMMWRWIPWTR